MFYLYGKDYCWDSIAGLLKTKLEEFDQLQSNYNKFLSENSIFETPITWQSPKIIDFEELKKYSPSFCRERKDYYGENSMEMRKKIKENYFADVIEQLKLINSDLYRLINFLARIIVINKLDKYFEGTTNYTIGLSNMDLHDKHSSRDFQELLLHQTVHMLLFINDRVKLQLIDPLKAFQVETDLDHKAGGKSFQLYIGFHSYVVGVEVLLHREATDTLDYQGKYHGPSERIIQMGEIAKKLIAIHLKKFTEHGQEIILRSSRELDRLARKMNLYAV